MERTKAQQWKRACWRKFVNRLLAGGKLGERGVQGTKFYIGFHEGNLAFKRALVRVWGLGQGLRV